MTAVYMKFAAKNEPFKPDFFTKDVLNRLNPLEWWDYFASTLTVDASIMKLLFTAVASSAGVERIFSVAGLVQSDIRNRLGNEKAAKLVAIYKHLNS